MNIIVQIGSADVVPYDNSSSSFILVLFTRDGDGKRYNVEIKASSQDLVYKFGLNLSPKTGEVNYSTLIGRRCKIKKGFLWRRPSFVAFVVDDQ